mmetsp:Transcript_7176/g.9753  ORF Transcript_7176/g.9753 Transcript_7176/m.9753 type:complete len:328 (+) Transcript_7176:116-1099(+)
MKQLSEKKLAFRSQLLGLLREHDKLLLIGADNVGSNHFQRIRSSLRNEATILMGKNTVIRKILRENEKEFPPYQQLLPKLYGNLGFVFTNGDITSIRRKILENKIGAPARVGAVAPCDVVLNAGPTGLDPGQTSFFQALDPPIPTMIARGQIEIKTNVNLIREGEKVTPSQAVLLTKLNLRPFKYGLSVKYVFDDGAFFDAKVLDLTEEDMISDFQKAVKKVASISLRVGYPTLASVPHSLNNAYKLIVHLSLATSCTFEGTEEIKALLDDPEALAKALAAASASLKEKKEIEEDVLQDENLIDPNDTDSDDVGFGGTFFSDDEDLW